MLGESLIRSTAGLFVACYVGRLLMDSAGSQKSSSRHAARLVWSLGCLIFWLHVLSAFQFLHGWSLAAAYEHVRQRTLLETGWNSGIGLYFNFLFGLLWLADVLLWWSWNNWPANRIAFWCIQSVFAFMMIQATVFFGPDYWKAVFVAVLVLLLSCRFRRHQRLSPTE